MEKIAAAKRAAMDPCLWRLTICVLGLRCVQCRAKEHIFTLLVAEMTKSKQQKRKAENQDDGGKGSGGTSGGGGSGNTEVKPDPKRKSRKTQKK